VVENWKQESDILLGEEVLLPYYIRMLNNWCILSDFVGFYIYHILVLIL